MPKYPRATNGEAYPWNSLRLPDFVHPLRYNLTIHPNLTTLDVKGEWLETRTSGVKAARDTNFGGQGG